MPRRPDGWCMKKDKNAYAFACNILISKPENWALGRGSE
jgi:hypothetical protein